MAERKELNYNVPDTQVKQALDVISKRLDKAITDNVEIANKKLGYDDLQSLVEHKRYFDQSPNGAVRFVQRIGNHLYSIPMEKLTRSSEVTDSAEGQFTDSFIHVFDQGDSTSDFSDYIIEQGDSTSDFSDYIIDQVYS